MRWRSPPSPRPSPPTCWRQAQQRLRAIGARLDKARLAGLPVFRAVREGEANGLRLRLLSYLFVHGHIFYQVEVSCLAADWSTWGQWMLAAVASFRLSE